MLGGNQDFKGGGIQSRKVMEMSLTRPLKLLWFFAGKEEDCRRAMLKRPSNRPRGQYPIMSRCLTLEAIQFSANSWQAEGHFFIFLFKSSARVAPWS